MNARMHSQRQMSRRQVVMAQLPDPFVYVQCGLCGTPTIVLARQWVPEDYEGTIALRSNHAAAVLGCRLMPDLAQLAQELGEVLGLHFPAQDCGAHQIREKNRQSMTFALRRFSGPCVHRSGARR